MISLDRASYQVQPRYAEYAGLSTDVKPIEVNNGDEFQEINTGFVYKFDETNGEWVKQPTGGGGSVGPQGPAGQDATIRIGSVISGDAPAVTNSGTETDAVLDFVLQQGPVGPQGPKGESVVVDGTLTISGAAADAKATGAALSQIKSDLATLENSIASETAGHTTIITPELVPGSVDYTNGAISDSGGVFARTGYIDVSGSASIFVDGYFWGYGSRGSCWFDSNKAYLREIAKNANGVYAVPTDAAYAMFTDYNSAGTHNPKSIIIRYVNKTAQHIENIAKNADYPSNFLHFSVDDSVFWTQLIDLSETEDPFEAIPILKAIKESHYTYGCKWSLYCFLHSGDNLISRVPATFAIYFENEKSWLKFGMHGYDIDWTYGGSDSGKTIANESQTLEHYNMFVDAVKKMTGSYEMIDRIPRMSSYKCSQTNSEVLRDHGASVVGFLAPEVDGVYPYWVDDREDKNDLKDKIFKLDHYFDFDLQMHLVHTTSPRLEAAAFATDYLGTIEYMRYRPMIEIYGHEDQFTNNPDLWNRNIATVCNWASANNVGHEFAQNVFRI